MNLETLTYDQSLVKYMPTSTINDSTWYPLSYSDSILLVSNVPNASVVTDLESVNATLTNVDVTQTILTILKVLILFAIIVGTIIGNILVCVAVCLVKKLRRPYNYLLVSLAVSDLCVAILVMPMALLDELLGEWQFGRVACDVWVSFDVLSCTASILNLCMISVDRYYAITKPLEYGVKRTPTRMIAYIVFVWISAAFVSVPPVLILGNEHGNGSICQVCQNFWYQIYATFGSFYIPLTVMVTVYYKIFQAAKRIVDEEKKAQAHLRNINRNGKHVSRQNQAVDIPTENNRRYSVVEINNGEVETKLVQELPSHNTSHPTWSPNSSSNCVRQSGSPPTNNLTNTDKFAKQDLQNHLEVPANESRHGNISPISTTTTCESNWSICQPKEGGMVSSHGEAIPSYLYDDRLKIDISFRSSVLADLSAKDSSKSLISKTDTNDVDSLASDHPVILECYRALEAPPKNNEITTGSEVKTNIDICNTSDSSSQRLLNKTLHDGERRKSSMGSPRRKYLLPKSKLRITLAKERKASTTLGIIMSAFIICWLPFFVLALVRPFLSEQGAIPKIVSSLFLWLGYANSLLNPIIYATLNKDFRKPFQEILCLRCASLNLLMREEFYYSQYGPDTPNHSNIKTRDSWDPPPVSGSERRCSKSLLPTNRRDTLSESRF